MPNSSVLNRHALLLYNHTSLIDCSLYLKCLTSILLCLANLLSFKTYLSCHLLKEAFLTLPYGQLLFPLSFHSTLYLSLLCSTLHYLRILGLYLPNQTQGELTPHTLLSPNTSCDQSSLKIKAKIKPKVLYRSKELRSMRCFIKRII